jgi:hypothetical protein
MTQMRAARIAMRNLRSDINFCKNYFEFRRETGDVELNLESKPACIADASALNRECKEECPNRRTCNGEQRCCINECTDLRRR